MKPASWKITLHCVVCGLCILNVWLEFWRPISEELFLDAPAAEASVPGLESSAARPEEVEVPLTGRPGRTKVRGAPTSKKGGVVDNEHLMSKEFAIALNCAASIFIALHNLPARDPASSSPYGTSPFAVFAVPGLI